MPETSHRAASRTRGRHRRPQLQADEQPILEVAGLSARTAGGKALLDDVSFTVQRGWLVAVVGPTGAGKTSLARALTGGLAYEGTVRLEGVALAGAGARHRDRIAYVPQDDVLHGQLGLGRTLAYAASLRLAPGSDGAERTRRVDAALRDLGLHGHADVPVASLSGGQRKRANIAAELVGRPDVIVLDEPTSGLDPGYEKAVMTSLRQIADGGRTVIAVTHSLAALSHCDRVLFLAEGGRVAYYGPPARAASYFGSSDAADVFLALDTQPGQAWKERFRAHPAYERYVTPVVAAASRATDRRPTAASGPGPRPGWSQQVGTLLRRQVALLRSDRRHLALLLLQGPLLGVLLWMVLAADSLRLIPGTATNTPASETVAMFVALSATWLGASNAVREIVKERHIVRREVDAGLAPSAYVTAKAIVLGALTMVQTTVLASIACAGQHPPVDGALGSGRLEIAAIGALVGLAATALGLLLSAAVTSPDKALALLPMTLVTELALAGGWASQLTAPGLPLLRDLTGARWGVEAIGATVAADSSAWINASVVLLGLTSGCLLATGALVRRHTRPALARRSAAAHLEGVRLLAERRGGAIGAASLGAATFGALAVALAFAGGADAPTRPPAEIVAEAPPAEAPVLEVPVDTVPPVTAAPTTVAPTPVTTPSTTPAPPTTPAPEPAPTTTAAPTTTSTVYVTPSTAPAPSGGVTTANAAAPWWTPWFWWAWAMGA